MKHRVGESIRGTAKWSIIHVTAVLGGERKDREEKKR